MNPKMTMIFTSQGGSEAALGERGKAIPVTVDGTRLGSATSKVTLKGPYLYARRSASPYKAVPFLNSTAIINPTNTTNATIDVADADAVKFRVNDTVTFYDVSAGALSAEGLVVSAIGAAGSGGAGETLVTLTGVWSTAPVASDLLVVKDGAELSSRVILIEEDIEFDGTTSPIVAGFVDGTFLKDLVNNTTYFVQHDNQELQLLDMQK